MQLHRYLNQQHKGHTLPLAWYQLYTKSGAPKFTIENVINCSYDFVKLHIIHEMCQGMGINVSEFFHSPLFDERGPLRNPAAD